MFNQLLNNQSAHHAVVAAEVAVAIVAEIVAEAAVVAN
jgi:hypothetical protein